MVRELGGRSELEPSGVLFLLAAMFDIAAEVGRRECEERKPSRGRQMAVADQEAKGGQSGVF